MLGAAMGRPDGPPGPEPINRSHQDPIPASAAGRPGAVRVDAAGMQGSLIMKRSTSPARRTLERLEKAVPMERLERALPVDKLEKSLSLDRLGRAAHSVWPRKKKKNRRLVWLSLLPVLSIAGIVAVRKLRAGDREPSSNAWETGWTGLGAEAQGGGSPGTAAVTEATGLDRFDSREIRDLMVVDIDGVEIGKVEAVYDHGEGTAPEWAALSTSDGRGVLVPLEGAERTAGALRVAYPRDFVRSAPHADVEALLGGADAELYGYYNLRRMTPSSTEGLATETQPLRRLAS
jgi:hypothetical protein